MNRKHQISVAGLTAGCLLSSGCLCAYWGNRWRDTKDVLTCTVGLGLGVKARVGPLQVPLIAQSDYAGMRCGECFASPMREDFWTYASEAGYVVDQPIPVYLRDRDTLYSGHETFDPGGAAAERHKCENSLGMGLVTVDRDHLNRAFYTQVECVVGAIVSVRVGINPGEVADWLVGFVGIDLMADDGVKEDRK